MRKTDLSTDEGQAACDSATETAVLRGKTNHPQGVRNKIYPYETKRVPLERCKFILAKGK